MLKKKKIKMGMTKVNLSSRDLEDKKKIKGLSEYQKRDINIKINRWLHD